MSAVIPARNEEAVIAGCVESLEPQAEIAEILVVNDHSSDRTAEIVRGLADRFPKIRLLETEELPPGWVGKNYAAGLGARNAIRGWLLFTDADAIHSATSVKRALEIARKNDAALVSFSPEQRMEAWYEKALIPYVYCRLSRFFSYADVNDPQKKAAAANGQFLLIRRDAYDAVGGHASVAGEVLEDVALAKRVKASGRAIWFGSGQGIVRVRMYRSFRSMWQGWRKNLYQLIGADLASLGREILGALAPLGIATGAAIAEAAVTESVAAALGVLAVGVAVVPAGYERELNRNGYPARLVLYGIPGRLLYAAVLLGSYRGYRTGRVVWKGREYPVDIPAASNMSGSR